jgi:hypothetical protein
MDDFTTSLAHEDLPFQLHIEREMKEQMNVGGFDALYLFTPDGLVLAAHIASESLLKEVHAVEFSVMISKMQKVVQRMSGLMGLKELVVEDADSSRFVFRFLTVFSQPALLLLVVPAHKNYRGLANRLCRLIEQSSVA